MQTRPFVVVLLIVVSATCRADVVGDVLDLAIRTTSTTPPSAVRTLAIVNLAMFDAANAIEQRYQPYRVQPVPPVGANADAAALGAGCAALAGLHPTQKANIAKECEAIAGRLPKESGIAEGRRFGEATGTAHVEARRDDGFGAINTYRPYAAPGVYTSTVLPIGFDAAFAKPFALRSPSQFRPGPPPALDSAIWARDYNEVKAMGSRDRSQRTAEQTATALFWASSGPQQYLDSLRDILAETGASATDRARFFALFYMTLFDAGIAVFDAKYTYNFWRPVTAIRNGDRDNNEATERDASWVPLIDTPMHPEYPCAHCNVSAAVGTVLLAFLGSGRQAKALSLRAASVTGQPLTTRQFRRVSDLWREVADARVWSGVHYRTSTEAGGAMGVAIGEWILATQVRPLTATR